MALYRCHRGTTYGGKALDEGAVVEIPDQDLHLVRDFVELQTEPAPVNPVSEEPAAAAQADEPTDQHSPRKHKK